MSRYITLMWAALFVLVSATMQDIEIKNIQVSVEAGDAVTAKDRAMDKAFKESFQALVRQTVDERYWQQLELTPVESIKNLAKSFSHDLERTTATSYKTTLRVVYDGRKLEPFFTARDINAIPAPQDPFLLVPIIKRGADAGIFDIDNPYLSNSAAAFEKSAINFILPLGDIDDLADLVPEELMAGNLKGLKRAARRYKVKEVILITVDKTNPSQVKMKKSFVNFEGNEPWVNAQPEVVISGEDVGQINKKLFEETQNATQQHWRDAFAIESQENPPYETVRLYALTLKEVIAFEAYLKNAPYVAQYLLETVRANEREYQITFKSPPEKFLFNLKRQGYRIERDGNTIRVFPDGKTAS